MSAIYFNTSRTVFQHDPTLQNIVWRIGAGNAIEFMEGDQVVTPAHGTSSQPEVTLDRIQFGDGYEQLTESGINSVRQVWDITFYKKRREVVRAFDRFFKGDQGNKNSIYYRRPSSWFYWQPPYPWSDKDNPAVVKVIAENFSVTSVEYNAFTITVQFRESFQP